MAPMPRPIGMSGPDPVYGYGRRWDEGTQAYTGAPKAPGYFGPIGVGGDVATEYAIGDEHGEIPTMVPGLTRDQLAGVVNASASGDPLPPGVVSKAAAHAAYRRLQGKSPFAGPQDKRLMIPASDYEVGGYRNIR